MDTSRLVNHITGFEYYNELSSINATTEHRYSDVAKDIGALLVAHAIKDPILSTLKYRTSKEEFSVEISTRICICHFNGGNGHDISDEDILDGMALDLKIKIIDSIYGTVKSKSKSIAHSSIPSVYEILAAAPQNITKDKAIFICNDDYKENVRGSCLHSIIDRFYMKIDGVTLYSSIDTDENSICCLPADIEVHTSGIKVQAKVLPDGCDGELYVIASMPIDIRCDASLIHTY